MLFAKRSHIQSTAFSIPFGVILSFVFLYHSLRFHSSFIVPIIVISVFVAMAAAWQKYTGTFGLYVDGTEITYKAYWKKKIDPQKIGAIKIARAVYQQQSGGACPLINKKGEPLYSMILLKESDLWERTNKDVNDHTFRSAYGEYAFCACIYDQNIINHLLTLNPNIYIF